LWDLLLALASLGFTSLSKGFKNIAKQYFQDFWQQLFLSLLKTPGTQFS
jgi:hypothetical protein